MAERRMFSKTLVDSDTFLDMPLSTQALYFHLAMRADDDGFVNNPKRIQRMIGANDDELKLLVAKEYVIPFDSGVLLIRHWKIHNFIRNDRYKESLCAEKMLVRLTKNKTYEVVDTIGIPDGIPDGIPSDIPVGDPGKDRLGKGSIEIGAHNIYTNALEDTEKHLPASEARASAIPEKILKLYQEKIRPVFTPQEREDLTALCKEHTAERVEAAIEKAVERGKGRLPYIKGILQNWSSDDDRKDEADGRVGKSSQRPARKTSSDWSNVEYKPGWN